MVMLTVKSNNVKACIAYRSWGTHTHYTNVIQE